MRISFKAISLVLSMTIMSGCDFLINRLVFYPDRSEYPVSELPEDIDEVFIETGDGILIQAYLIDDGSSDRILVYFHGNAGNISHRIPDLSKINSFGVGVLGVGYRGYGKSGGSPSEEGIYLDGEAALSYVTGKLGYRPENVILLGRSIGSAVAVHLAARSSPGGLILVTPLTDGKDLARAAGLGFLVPMAGDSFDNIGRIGKVTCPILFLHGTRDSVIPIDIGRKLFEAASGDKRFVEVEGADHNDMSTSFARTYWPPIKEFIQHEGGP